MDDNTEFYMTLSCYQIVDRKDHVQYLLFSFKELIQMTVHAL